jgi:hypothetical protein
MFCFAGLSVYTLMANNPEAKFRKSDPVECLVTSAIIVEPAHFPLTSSAFCILDQVKQNRIKNSKTSAELPGFSLHKDMLFIDKAAQIQTSKEGTSEYVIKP